MGTCITRRQRMAEKKKRKKMVDTRNDAWQRNKHMVSLYVMLIILAVVLIVGTTIYIRSRTGSLWLHMPLNNPESIETAEKDLKEHLSLEDWDTGEKKSLWDATGKPVPMPGNGAGPEDADGFSRYAYYGSIKIENGETYLRVDSNQFGKTVVSFDAEEADLRNMWLLRMVPYFGKTMIVRSDGYFEGCEALTFAVIFFLGIFAVTTGYISVHLQRRALFSYRMVVNGGLSLYATCQFLIMVFYIFEDLQYPGFTLFQRLVDGVLFSTIIISPIMLIGALAVAISNIQLIRHEGFRPKNLLGILIAVAWIGALALYGYFGRDFSGSLEEVRKLKVMQTSVAVIMNFAFFLLVTTVLSAYLAQKHRPMLDKDYIIILGCHIRKDGTPTPILKGRVDRALAFEKKQYQKTGKHAVFVPSGGQGKDEPTSEAESMRQYLLAQGVPDERILPEHKSENTFQNIRNSKKLILAADKNARVAFSTTNYHVFRSYVLSKENNLYAEGMSAKTKGYFFPNAFLREFFGLLYAEKIPILLTLTGVVCTYLTFALLLE